MAGVRLAILAGAAPHAAVTPRTGIWKLYPTRRYASGKLDTSIVTAPNAPLHSKQKMPAILPTLQFEMDVFVYTSANSNGLIA
jgi:hypothetical protein